MGCNLCSGIHSYNNKKFQLIAKPITIGAHVWVAAEAIVHPGVTIGEGNRDGGEVGGGE